MRLFRTWDETKKMPENGRLAWYTGTADVDYWTNATDKLGAAALLSRAREADYLHRSLLLQFLPTDMPILDGGCNIGHIVHGLQADGYDAVGIEWSPHIVEWARSIVPDLNISVGDVNNIPFPDGYFGGYISLGVIEHFPDGPDKSLAEANRVLCNDGHLILTVPYFSLVRQLKARLRLYPRPPSKPEPKDFYQYAFSQDEMPATNRLVYQSRREATFAPSLDRPQHFICRQKGAGGDPWVNGSRRVMDVNDDMEAQLSLVR